MEKSGHSYIGKHVVRIHLTETVCHAFKGTITKWKQAESTDTPNNFRITVTEGGNTVYPNGSLDLTEKDTNECIRIYNFLEEKEKEGMKLLEGHEFVGQRVVLKYEENSVNAVVVGYWPKTEVDEENWLVIHEDGDAEDLTRAQIDEGFAEYARSVEKAEMKKRGEIESSEEESSEDEESSEEETSEEETSSEEEEEDERGIADVPNKTLWKSLNAREQWTQTVQISKSIGMIATCIEALSDNAHDFGVVADAGRTQTTRSGRTVKTRRGQRFRKRNNNWAV